VCVLPALCRRHTWAGVLVSSPHLRCGAGVQGCRELLGGSLSDRHRRRRCSMLRETNMGSLDPCQELSGARAAMHMYRMDLKDRIRERERIRRGIVERDQVFISDVIRDRFHCAPSPDSRILDFGCGIGEIVSYLHSLGYDAYGCDVAAAWEQKAGDAGERLAVIPAMPYRLPYEDGTFDVVFSTSVLEHARNTEESFREIHRVLKGGGISMHMFPGKWYLPYEPHIRIPLANFLWPRCPEWWIGMWVLLRVAYVPRLAPYWRSMYREYCEFCRSGMVYLSNRRYRDLSLAVFGNYGSLMDFYIARSGGGYARLARKLPFRTLSGWLSSHFRMNLIFQEKRS
jgi:SAM-dependent methyltransferase